MGIVKAGKWRSFSMEKRHSILEEMKELNMLRFKKVAIRPARR